MTKVEYIRTSHREANRKIRGWLDGVYDTLNGKSRMLGWLWRMVAWVIFGVVWVVSWLAFITSLLGDVRFTLHYMECEIGDLPPDEARQYLLDRQQEYTRHLSYGSISAKKQKRIDKTFEYLFAKYPAPVEKPLSDLAAERHTQMIGEIAEVKSTVKTVATYTDRKTREDTEREKKEAEALAAAEVRRVRHRQKSGFEPNPVDFSPKMSDTQIALLTKHMNEMGVFRWDVTAEEVTQLLLCEHTTPLQTTHNKMVALLLETLCTEGLITPKWQRVAEHYKCFTSKQGKPLTAKDLSSAKQMADFMADKKYDKIIAAVNAVVKLR